MSSLCVTVWSGLPRSLPILVLSCVAVCSWLLMTLPWFTGSVRWHCVSTWPCYGLLWTFNYNFVRFKCIIAVRIITPRWFPTTIFEQFPIGVIPGANPHTVLGSDHASLDANDYHRLQVIQKCQAIFTFLLAKHRAPTLIFITAVCLLLSAYCFIFCFCSRSRQRIIVSSLYLGCPLTSGNFPRNSLPNMSLFGLTPVVACSVALYALIPRFLYFSNTSFRLSVPSDWLLSVAIESQRTAYCVTVPRGSPLAACTWTLHHCCQTTCQLFARLLGLI